MEAEAAGQHDSVSNDRTHEIVWMSRIIAAAAFQLQVGVRRVDPAGECSIASKIALGLP